MEFKSLANSSKQFLSLIKKKDLIIKTKTLFNTEERNNGYDGYSRQNNILVEELTLNESINFDSSSSKSLLHSANIKKIPLPPIAPPRIPLFSSELREDIGNNGVNDGINIIGTGSGNSNSVSYRPVPPPVRREVKSEGECYFDPNQWQMQAQSATANAIMFDRSSGINCNECLERCSKQFQNQSTEWICRSLTYDHRWKICDLFAVNGGDYPYNLLDYEGRDYFQYMPALPPTDIEMLGINKQNEINNNNKKQCLCPCNEIIKQKNIQLNLTEINDELFINKNNLTNNKLIIPSSSSEQLNSFLLNNNSIEQQQFSSNQLVKQLSENKLNLLNNTNSSKEILNNNLINSSSSLTFISTTTIPQSFISSLTLEKEEKQNKSFGSKTFEPQKDFNLNKTIQLIQKPILKQQKKKNNNNICPKEEQIPYYIEIEGKLERKKIEKLEKINGIKNYIECLDICDNNNNNNNEILEERKEKIFNCNSIQWTTSKGFCIEKTILLKSNNNNNNRNIFKAIPGYILVGHVQEVSNSKSLSECLQSCLSSFTEYGFNCKSLMFYPSDSEQNCLMNSESRHTQSDVFVPEEQNDEFMIYLDLDIINNNNNTNNNIKQKNNLSNEQRRFYDSPINKIKNDEWTNWSKCLDSETAIEMRHRYLKCRESKDIRKCPKETIPCKKKPTIKIQRIWN
ncbi:Apple domain-containing protein [Meloidogyne graminicola]|uniref:Apple domain-containing protein n=1 Tax=Meloidogyne graminicola TaxID=189291 RepID=A0A8S9ZL69_9BILA|nr:Apple domain-containing protein [Meloidogyne graminicola]